MSVAILIVEYNGMSLKREVSDLHTGLLEAAEYLPGNKTKKARAILSEPLTVATIAELRELLPGLRVVGHYLNSEDAGLLDRS